MPGRGWYIPGGFVASDEERRDLWSMFSSSRCVEGKEAYGQEHHDHSSSGSQEYRWID